MCIPLVGRVQELGEPLVTVKLIEGEVVPANAGLHPDVEAGAWVLLDRGLIVEVIDEAQANEILAFYSEIEQLWEKEDAAP